MIRKVVHNGNMFRYLLDESPYPLVVLQDDKYRYVNKAFLRLFKYTKKDIENGLSFFKLVKKGDRERVREIYNKGKRLARHYEIDMVTKKGSVIPCEASATLIEYDNRPANLMIIRDIRKRKKDFIDRERVIKMLEKRVKERTQELTRINQDLLREINLRKKIEEGLLESEKRFRAAATTTADLIWEGDVRNNSLQWYGDIDRMLGYDIGEFPRTITGHLDHIHPDDHKGLSLAIEDAIKSGRNFYYQYRIRGKDGSYRFWDERGKPVLFENGTAVKWVGSVTDVTESRMAFERLQISEQRFKKLSKEFNTLLDAIPDRLLLLGRDLKIRWANRAFMEKLKKREAEVSGRYCYSICCKIKSPCRNCPVIKCFRSGREEITRVIDSEGRILDKRAFPVIDESGDFINVIEIARDVTARVRMEEEAKLVQSRLIHANKMTSLGLLVSGVAHEINNPNSFIMSNAQVFEDIWNDVMPVLSREAKKDPNLKFGGLPFSELHYIAPVLIQGLKEGSRRIKNIVDSLNNFSRADRSDLNEDVNINNIVSSAKSILENQINRFTDNFRIRLGRDIPSVKGSSQQLEQVLINLILNALQSLPDRSSGVLVTTTYNQKSRIVSVKVKDEGRGIPDEIIDIITEPFFTTKHEMGGTGLGLSISYTIVRDHKGTLSFRSKKGKGTTVCLELPEGR